MLFDSTSTLQARQLLTCHPPCAISGSTVGSRSPARRVTAVSVTAPARPRSRWCCTSTRNQSWTSRSVAVATLVH